MAFLTDWYTTARRFRIRSGGWTLSKDQKASSRPSCARSRSPRAYARAYLASWGSSPAAPVRAEAQHPVVRGRTGELTPARPLVLERIHRPLHGPRAGQARDRVGQLVDGQLGVRQRRADGRDDLVCLLGSEPHPLRMGRHRKQSRQRAGPHGQVDGGQQVHGAARAERLDQGAVLPKRALHVGPGGPGDAPSDGELRGAEHLGVRAAQHPGDVGWAQAGGRLGQGVPGHPPGGDTLPGQGGRGRSAHDHPLSRKPATAMS